MAYVRPVNKMPLSKQKKIELLKEYAAYHRDAVAADDTALNRKIPRDAFIGLLDRIGSLLIDESARLAMAPGPVVTSSLAIRFRQTWRRRCRTPFARLPLH